MAPVDTDGCQPYWRRIRQLRENAGLSQPQLYRHVEGLSLDMLRSLERDPDRPTPQGQRSRARYPSPETLEKVAAGLGVEPAIFPEYRLAKAREELDERVVGLDQANERLSRIVAALQQTAVERRATEGERRARRPRAPASRTGEDATQGAG